MNYRHRARESLNLARAALEGDLDDQLKYAALEIRMAMEALTYERALKFKEDIPPEEYDTWQPKKVMSFLLSLDPKADKDIALSMGEEEKPGLPAGPMVSLGSEKVLNLATLKRHYDAIGSYLHMPTMKQCEAGKLPNNDRLRERVKEALDYVEVVLASPIWGVVFKLTATLDCVECGATMRRRLPPDRQERDTKCFNCGASYTLRCLEDKKVEWTLKRNSFACGGCGHIVDIGVHNVKLGSSWVCSICSGRNTISLGIHFTPGDPKLAETANLSGIDNSA